MLAATLAAPLPGAAQVLSQFGTAPFTTPSRPATPTTPPPSILPPAQITPEQARQALDVLNDPAKRAEITATLEAIARAQPAASGTSAPPLMPATAAPASPTPAIPTLLTPRLATPTTATLATVPPPTVTPPTVTPTSVTPASVTLGIPLAPDSLGADVLVGAANFMKQVADEATATLHAARGIPLLWEWLVTMATDPIAHTLLIDLGWRLAVALAVSFAVLWAVSRVVRRPLRVVGRRLMLMPPAAPIRQPTQQARDEADEQSDLQSAAQPGEAPGDSNESGEALAGSGEVEAPRQRRFDLARVMRRLPLVLASVALYLLPVLGFIVAGHVIAGSALGTTSLVRLVLLAVIDSYALCAVTLHLAGALLAPRHGRLRLLPVRDATAMYAFRWTRRLLVVGVVGYAAAEVGLLLGLSQAAHLALLKATVLVLHIFIAIIVIQKRRVVRRWIRSPEDATGVFAAVRDRLAAIWHWIALFYLAALWLVWAVALPAGYERLSRALLTTLAVVVLARLTRRGCNAALDRLLLAGGIWRRNTPVSTAGWRSTTRS